MDSFNGEEFDPASVDYATLRAMTREAEGALLSSLRATVRADEERSANPIQRPKQRRNYIVRDRVNVNERLMADYFCEAPLYGPTMFRRRFRMSKEIFLQLVDGVSSFDPYFTQRETVSVGMGSHRFKSAPPLFECFVTGHPEIASTSI
jgi:hypothetical protein